MDFKKKISEIIAENIKNKLTFNILYVSDENSRMAFSRGMTAMEEFKHFYGNLANVSVTTMDSKRFIDIAPDLGKYNVLWIDNVINRTFNNVVVERVGKVMDSLVPDWRKEMDNMSDEAKSEYMADANEFRAMSLRVIYCIDEFVWDAPAGRQKTIIDGLTVQDAMGYADEVIVPNVEMASVIKDIGLVAEDKEVLIIPTFMSDSFYPINKIFHKSNSLQTTIRKPKILVKGTSIPKNVQNFIIHSCEDYDFTICTVSELDERLTKLLQTPRKDDKKAPIVRNLQHWSNPYVNARNMTKTIALERDAAFDFTILTVPEDIESDIYNLTNVDTDALMAIAGGSVAIAEVDDAEYQKGTHVCVDTGMTFGLSTSVKAIGDMIEKWSICAHWDNAFDAQRKILGTRLVSSPAVLGGFFNAMLGRRFANERKKFYGEQDETETTEA